MNSATKSIYCPVELNNNCPNLNDNNRPGERRISSCKTWDDGKMLEIEKIGNEFRGEFIVIPNHLIEDEGMNGNRSKENNPDQDIEDNFSVNSDDCIYAYRGENLEDAQQEQVDDNQGADNQEDDDETDFLEMDFDPEPNSEQDNFTLNSSNSNGCISLRGGGPDHDSPTLLRPQLQDANETLNGSYSVELAENSSKNQSSIDCIQISVAPIEIAKMTGARPKTKIQAPVEVKSPEPESKKEVYFEEPNSSGKYHQQSLEEQCLDCSELDFINHTNLQSGFKWEEGKCWKHIKKQRNHEDLKDLSDPVDLNSEADGQQPQIQISTSDFNEEIIFKSLSLIGVKTVNRETLQELIRDHESRVEKSKTLVEYLVNFSKSKFDHKRLAKIIRLSCTEELSIEFKPITKEQPETVELELNPSELLSRWSPLTPNSLNDLFSINNRHFLAANVPGKVINVLRRQAAVVKQQPSITPPLSPIKVPCFHTMGFLVIKKSSVSHQ